MSADNWGDCPRCLKNQDNEKAAAQERARAAYGTVTAKEYELLLVTANAPVKAHIETLREDYEVRMDREGTFTVDYAASCQTCGFRFSFEHSAVVDLSGTP